MSAGAGGARTFVAQVGHSVFAVMVVLPVDLDAFGFGDGDVLESLLSDVCELVGRISQAIQTPIIKRKVTKSNFIFFPKMDLFSLDLFRWQGCRISNAFGMSGRRDN